MNRQCTACAATAEAKAHAMEQSVSAPAPYRREDYRRGKNSRTSSTRNQQFILIL